jgi:hypothetical protein
MLVPLRPAIGAFRESGLGPIGIARCRLPHCILLCRSGAFLYNHKDAAQTVAVVREGQTFDNCNGHADPMCRWVEGGSGSITSLPHPSLPRYHYHMAPVCMASNCSLAGYLTYVLAMMHSKPGTPGTGSLCTESALWTATS